MMEKAETDPYLSEGIIAYIGNKRRLLSLIGEALEQAAGGSPEGLNFTDLFSGSGIVARYARTLGMKVTANDWEPYARVLAEAWLVPVPADIERIFGSPDGLAEAVDLLNNLPVPEREEEYLARYYAPSSMNPDEADYRRERLFYTRENALRLDAARNFLEKTDAGALPEWRGPGKSASSPGHPGITGAVPSPGIPGDISLRRSLLLAPIIYAGATRVNTSGVFKAFHKGFGGHGKDALKRIISPIEFQPPLVIDAPPGRVFSEDAVTLASGGAVSDADIVYLDPPYNQHQYGSNYHLLNTLVRWDRIPEPLEKGEDGRLLRKAGIRKDWKKTKSLWCSRKTAPQAFDELMDALQAPLVLLSYSTDGIIPFDHLRSRCEAYGRVRLAANPYVTYRGGRQSNRRQDRNLEFVLIVEKGRHTRSRDRRELERILLNRRLQNLLNDLYRPDCLRNHGEVSGDSWKVELPSAGIAVSTRYLVLIRETSGLSSLDDENLRAFLEILEKCRCGSRNEELEVLLSVWENNPGESRDLVKLIPRILKKMAHKKYQDEFLRQLKALRETGARFPEDFALISSELDRIETQVQLRMQG